MKIIFEDNDIIAVIKPAGMEAQASKGFEPDMESELKNYLSGDIKNPYLGIIHRLDKPVFGLMLFAKTKKAAAKLSKDMADGKIKKLYQAVVYGKPEAKTKLFKDYIKKEKRLNISQLCSRNEKEAKEAVLSYTLVNSIIYNNITLSLLNIKLFTGRHHQIRLQLSHHSLPIIGDRKYGISSKLNDKSELNVTDEMIELEKYNIALACVKLIFRHPVSEKSMELSFEAKGALWDLF